MKINLTLSMIGVSLSLLMACSSSSPSANKPFTKKSGDQTSTKTPSKTDTKSDNSEGNDEETDQTGVGETTNPSTGEDPNTGEVGEPVVTPKVNMVGGIDPTNAFVRFGEVTGWAVNKDDLKTYLNVNIYFDGDNTSGKKVGTVKANLVGSDEGNGGEHAFIFYVPKESIDSKPHKVYAYAVIDDKEVAISSKMPYTLSFFKPKGGEAQAMYNSIGFTGVCKQCHSFTYDDRWDKLAQDGLSGKAWSESTNYLYEKITTSHRTISGGSPCNSIKCDNIKAWWRLEFGQ